MKTLLDMVQEQLPMVAVKKALMAAAGGTDSAYIVDNVSKVVMRTETSPHILSVNLVLEVWWKIDDEEHHVTMRKVLVDDGAATSYEQILDELLNFEPEDVLKYAGYF